MAKVGQYHSVSYFRRLVTDLMYFSVRVPNVTVERHMNLAPLVEARRASDSQPTWSAIFTKAFARVAAQTPALRTVYLTFPWPRFYEHFTNLAMLNVDRQLETERIVVMFHLSSPEALSLQEIDAIIRSHQEEPVENLSAYCRAVRLSRIPWPLRRLIWWIALNWFGSLRCRYFGTFGVTSVGSIGAGITHIETLMTAVLHFGMLDPDGGMEVRLTFDHRVLDGAAAAQALVDLERVLLEDMVVECSASAV